MRAFSRTETKYRSRRRGSMLVELCSSIAAASMIMLLGAMLIDRSMRWAQSMKHQTTLQRELSQLAAEYRKDFSTAQRVEFPTNDRVVFSMVGKNVIYEVQKTQVVRRCEVTDAQVAMARSPESYLLGDGYQATFESPCLVVRTLNPAGEIMGTRLRVSGKRADERYKMMEDKP